jgi:RND family efflux transporter MFP subunit
MDKRRPPAGGGFPLLVLLAVAAGTGVTACGPQQQQAASVEVVRPVKTLVVGGDDAARRRELPGTVRAAERVDLAFQTAGKIIELPVKQGQPVKKGDLIARLDDRSFRANVRAAEAQYKEAEANFKRAHQLVAKDFISKTEYENLRARRDTAEADLEKARKALEDTVIRAPFAGVLAKRTVENFQEVQAKQEIGSLQDTSSIEIVVAAPERLVALRGRVANVKLLAVFDTVPGRSFDVTVKEFATVADPTTQTFQYVLMMPQPAGTNILPGMTAIVKVSADLAGGDTAPSDLVVPAQAVFADAAGTANVWVVDPASNTVQLRQVQTGDLAGGEDIRVVSGLQAGEMIAVAAVTRLRAGMKIRPVDKIEY